MKALEIIFYDQCGQLTNCFKMFIKTHITKDNVMIIFIRFQSADCD